MNTVLWLLIYGKKVLQLRMDFDAYRSYFTDVKLNPVITWLSLAHGVKVTNWIPISDERAMIDFIFFRGE